jgi:hypothetical protein
MQEAGHSKNSLKLAVRILDFQPEAKGNLLGRARVIIPKWGMVLNNIRVHISGDVIYVSNVFSAANSRPTVRVIPSATFINERGRRMFEEALLEALNAFFVENPVEFQAI